MASDIEINLIEQWVSRIYSNATRQNCVILLLGNNESGMFEKKQRISFILNKILSEHKMTCEACAKRLCHRLLTGEFNLQTGHKLDDQIKKFVQSMLRQTPNFIKDN